MDYCVFFRIRKTRYFNLEICIEIGGAIFHRSFANWWTRAEITRMGEEAKEFDDELVDYEEEEEVVNDKKEENKEGKK